MQAVFSILQNKNQRQPAIPASFRYLFIEQKWVKGRMSPNLKSHFNTSLNAVICTISCSTQKIILKSSYLNLLISCKQFLLCLMIFLQWNAAFSTVKRLVLLSCSSCSPERSSPFVSSSQYLSKIVRGKLTWPQICCHHGKSTAF